MVYVTVDSIGRVGSYSSIAFDSMGQAAISYRDVDAKKLKIARWDGSAWATETVPGVDEIGAYTCLLSSGSLATGNLLRAVKGAVQGEIELTH